MKLIILDKDGTLTTSKSGNKFVQSPEDQVLLPGVLDALKWHQSQGHTMVIASNQGGVASGHKSIQDAIAEIKYCLQLCGDLLEAAFFCPNYEGNGFYAAGLGVPSSHCQFSIAEVLGYDKSLPLKDTGYFRKPGPVMLLYAMETYNFNAPDCLMVGDRPEDEGAAQAAGCAFQDALSWRSEFL